jgi:hypothetical protein
LREVLKVSFVAAIRFVWTLLWSPLLAGLASLYLAVEGLVDQRQRSIGGIFAAAGFIVVSSIVNFIREQSLARRMTRTDVQINQRLTSLIGSLGEISADNYHYWKVELYTAHWRLRWTRLWPWILRKVLLRRASVNIVSTMALHDSCALLEDGPIGLCFREQRQEVWLSPDAGTAANPADIYSRISPAINEQLRAECGVMRTAPVTNHLDADCIGVLCVHVEPQFGPMLAGTILMNECANRLRMAAIELNQIVRG